MQEIKLTGEVKKIIFEGDSGYKIFAVKFEDSEEEEVCVGYCQIDTSCRYEFTGNYIEHPKYGEQLKIKSAKIKDLNEGEEIISFLSSSNFQGIGKFTAQKIYDHFQSETISILKSEPERINEVNVSDKVKEEILNKFIKLEGIEELYQLLIPLNFSDFLIEEIYKTLYTKKIQQIVKYLKDDPYALIKDTYRFTFRDADRIYLKFNQNKESEKRLLAGLNYAIYEFCYRTGDTLLTKKELVEALNKTFVEEIETEQIIELAVEEKEIIKVEENYISKEFYKEEMDIARNLKLRIEHFNDKTDLPHFESYLLEIAEKLNINYSDLQKEAIEMSLTNQLSIITGGPGTGKTTIIQGICKMYSKYYLKNDGEDVRNKIMLCAPTGRAAQRMKEATGYSAKTIHSLLEWEPHTNRFNRDLEDQLIQELIIIDEFSMVDIFLANALFKAIRPTAKIVIVGDPAQLESVNPGNVLADLLNYDKLARTHLSEIFRQGDGSEIARLAKKIDNNVEIDLRKTHDMSVIERESNLLANIEQIINKSYEAGYNEMEVQILYPMYGGKTGIDRINETLKPERVGKQIEVNNVSYQVGDKIMQLKNNYDKNIYNGDIGFITKIHSQNPKPKEIAISIKIRDKEIDLTKMEMLELKHAYAISIHKSQGSEFKVVILPMSRDSEMMHSKKLLYTAITRAKDKLIIVGDIDSFKRGVIESDYLRKTALGQFINLELIN